MPYRIQDDLPSHLPFISLTSSHTTLLFLILIQPHCPCLSQTHQSHSCLRPFALTVPSCGKLCLKSLARPTSERLSRIFSDVSSMKPILRTYLKLHHVSSPLQFLVLPPLHSFFFHTSYSHPSSYIVYLLIIILFLFSTIFLPQLEYKLPKDNISYLFCSVIYPKHAEVFDT